MFPSPHYKPCLSLPLPFTAKSIHPIGTFGILLEKEPTTTEFDLTHHAETTTPSKPSDYNTFLSSPDSPTIYSIPHKLYEPCPVAIKPYKSKLRNFSNQNTPAASENTQVIEQTKFSNSLTIAHTSSDTVVLFDANRDCYYISKIRKITLDELENMYTEAIIQESGLIDPDTTVDLIENAMRNISITSPVVQSRRNRRNGSENKDSLRRSSRHLYSPSAHFGNLTLNTPPSSGSSFKSVSRLITPENTGFIPSSNLRNHSNPLLKSTLRSNLLKSAATETRNMQDDTSFIFNQLTPTYDFKTPVKSPKMTLRSGKTYHKIDMSVSNLTSDVHKNLSTHHVEKTIGGGGCSFPDLVLEIVAEPVQTTGWFFKNVIKMAKNDLK